MIWTKKNLSRRCQTYNGNSNIEIDESKSKQKSGFRCSGMIDWFAEKCAGKKETTRLRTTIRRLRCNRKMRSDRLDTCPLWIGNSCIGKDACRGVAISTLLQIRTTCNHHHPSSVQMTVSPIFQLLLRRLLFLLEGRILTVAPRYRHCHRILLPEPPWQGFGCCYFDEGEFVEDLYGEWWRLPRCFVRRRTRSDSRLLVV